MVEMVIDVPENWRAFLLDVADRFKEEPAKYWGEYFTEGLMSGMEGDRDYLFCNLQMEMMKEHGIKCDRT